MPDRLAARVCVVGGGLAGALLGWRLAAADPGTHVTLVGGPGRDRDATHASGGLVRAFETDPAHRALAGAALAELLDSRVLRSWSRYRPAGSLYVLGDGADPDQALTEIEALIPGSVRLAAAAELARQGWRALPDGTVAVVEDRAGFISPDALRLAVTRDFALRPNATLVEGAVGRLGTDRRPAVAIAGEVPRQRTGEPADRSAPDRLADDIGCDLLVVAAGPWTPALLAAQGWPAPDLHTKAIQYTVFATRGRRPPPFVDGTTGLYGRPHDGGLLLGVPSAAWGVDPDRPAVDGTLTDEALRLVRLRLPHLRIGTPHLTVAAVDCYAEPPGTLPGLALRPVPAAGGRVLTFTGGSGGAAKTALAASRRAADELLGLIAGGRDPVDGQPPLPAPTGWRTRQT